MWPKATSACRRTAAMADVTSSGSQMPTATSVRQWTSPGRDIAHSQAALPEPGNHRWQHGHGKPSSWPCRAVVRTAPSPGACWPAARGGVRPCALRRAEPRPGGVSRNRTTRFRTPRCACMGFTWNTRIAVRSILQSSMCGCALPVRSSGWCLSGLSVSGLAGGDQEPHEEPSRRGIKPAGRNSAAEHLALLPGHAHRGAPRDNVVG